MNFEKLVVRARYDIQNGRGQTFSQIYVIQMMSLSYKICSVVMFKLLNTANNDNLFFKIHHPKNYLTT